MKQHITLLAFGLLLTISCQKKEEKIEETTIQEVTTETPVTEEVIANGETCYLQVVSKDSISLKIKKEGDKVTGTFKSVPYEKDKRTIIFEGSLNGDTVTAVGSATGEGETQKEEFIFILKNNQAGVKFGEMIQGDDDVYRYKSKNSATPLYISKIDCQ